MYRQQRGRGIVSQSRVAFAEPIDLGARPNALSDAEYTRRVVQYLAQYRGLSMAIGCGNVDDLGFECKMRLGRHYDVTLLDDSVNQVDKSDVELLSLIVDFNDMQTWPVLRPLISHFKEIAFDRNSVYYFRNARFVKVIYNLLQPGGVFIFPMQVSNSSSLLDSTHHHIVLDGLLEEYTVREDGMVLRHLLLEPGRQSFYRNVYKSITTPNPYVHIDAGAGVITFLVNPNDMIKFNINLIERLEPWSSSEIKGNTVHFGK